MRYKFNVDQGQYDRGDGSGIISGLTDLRDYMAEERKARLAEKRAADNDEYMRGLNRISEQRANAAERRDADKHRNEQSDRRRKVVDEGLDRFYMQSPGEAEAYFAGAGLADEEGNPASPRLHREEQELPEKPDGSRSRALSDAYKDAPVRDPSRSATDPPTLEETEHGAKVDSRMFDAVGEALEEGHHDEQAAIPPELRARYRLDIPGEQSMTLDPADRERVKAQRDQARKDRMLEMLPSVPLELRPAFMLRAGLTGAGASGAEGGQLMNRESMEDAQANTDKRDNRNVMPWEKRYEIDMTNAKRPRGAINMTGAQRETAERGWNAQANTELQQYFTNQGYQGQVGQYRAYTGMLEDFKSGNTAQMMGGLGAWVKEKSGGSAVITENEIKRYATAAIPWDERVQKQFDYWVKGGQIDEAYVQPFTQALEKAIIARQRSIVDKIGKGARATLMSNPNPEVQRYADGAYLKAISPLMSEEELEEYIAARAAGSKSAIPPGRGGPKVAAAPGAVPAPGRGPARPPAPGAGPRAPAAPSVGSNAAPEVKVLNGKRYVKRADGWYAE